MAISHSMEPKKFSVVCDNCFTEITNLTYVQCYECTLDLCLPCFLNQTETPIHSKYHQYRVISRMRTDLYGEGWSLLEEILFIGGLETCGIGNWADISSYVGNDKSAEEHFYRLFKIERDLNTGSEVVKEKFSNPHKGLINSYMPYRKDFDTEYMNDQEMLIKDLSFSEGDDEIKKRFIKATLKSYMDVVSLRNRRKYVILDRDLMDIKSLKKKDENAGGKFIGDIKCIAPYLTKSDFNTLFNGMYIENKLSMLLKGCIKATSDKIDLKKLMSPDNLLIAQERAICEACKISPVAYLELKKEVISYFTKKKEFTRHKLKRLLGVLDQRVSLLHDFFQVQGWIYKDKENQA